ncbi:MULTISPECIES: sigma-70 family RNA polymerase sigma factor [Streptomyces]|uniref:RNA polymerase sigma factor n=2 Tax=Streptomyces TaxID=1883 RepID=A0A100Y2A0_9ACTN|nr:MULTISPECIES: sigma-70 family RNA polymerase sigma factor [Streptomyces]KUH36372.1 RNA polymerase [Streptomyces kanasensis]UUS31224.1 sigma-70 family RNA polymerase sigma factor [Streptomyces changanensis]
MQREPEAAVVRAAQQGETWAQDRLIAAYLPLVYNIVGRALNGHADVDDVVQESLIRALTGLDALRDPDRFRSWLVAITMNGIRAHHTARASGAVAVAPDRVQQVADPGADFVDLTIVRLGLSGQRREVAEATRWLDADDRELLSLWWLEAAGRLTRVEVAAALDLSPQHTAVRVQRTKGRLEMARLVVRALAAVPRCVLLDDALGAWDGAPSALWRKRLARHVRDCTVCSGYESGLVPAEGLLAGLGLVPVAAGLLAALPGGDGPSLAETTAATPAAAAAGGPAVVVGRRAAQRGAARARRRRTAAGAAVALLVGAGAVTGVVLLPGDGDTDAVRVQSALPGDGNPRPLAVGSLQPAAPTAPSPSTASSSPSPAASASASPAASASPKPSATAGPTSAPSPSATPSARRSTPTAERDDSDRSGGTSRRYSATRPSGGGSYGDRVTALVNTERARNGCGPVSRNGLLDTAALRHSEDMDARDYFDHRSPDGTDPGDRVTAAGYRWSTYGENIARGQQTPEAVMESWMNSPGHRANILNCSFKEIGVGRHDASGGPWWTQVFGAAG